MVVMRHYLHIKTGVGSIRARFLFRFSGRELKFTMASLRRKPNSRFWIACFTDDNGLQRQVSTKETSRSKAEKLAEKFESVYKMRLTEAQARKVVADIYEEIRGEQLYHATGRAFLAGWLQSKIADTASGTQKRYNNAVNGLDTRKPRSRNCLPS